jgi:hypothetical protein
MIAITTNNSISVNPSLFFVIFILCNEFLDDLAVNVGKPKIAAAVPEG